MICATVRRAMTQRATRPVTLATLMREVVAGVTLFILLVCTARDNAAGAGLTV